MKHIADAIIEIENYLIDVDFNSFLGNSMMKFACIKQLEIIGEASNHISSQTKKRCSNIEWAQIVGLRNVFVHEYFGIDSNLVWDILINDLPVLKQKITSVLSIIETE
ncbi:HepT-like ribonuclease domain-containing protein [Algoriphagus persicinus]|uniref:HepT-like ribonuclease domain-containing protein n=1 Tax=Algoriphagus persicinus TaxID=3108754 RepID=UPI002B3E943B|nr:DUF86 domain-containing protein [Algoriphagus sp. E1-3-M2]MEB2781315.1 DUF86 domain-containing protein [Algoriphagus sp. C2-6-M1]MEB2784930.1 DUF86 domain-containing protein [Algoriphagus sp. E1-3-M2]